MDFYNPLFARQAMLEAALAHPSADSGMRSGDPSMGIMITVYTIDGSQWCGQYIRNEDARVNEAMITLGPLSGSGRPIFIAMDAISIIAPGDNG